MEETRQRRADSGLDWLLDPVEAEDRRSYPLRQDDALHYFRPLGPHHGGR